MAIWNIPDPASLPDRSLRAFLEPIRNNLMTLLGQFSNTTGQRALTPDELVTLGILGKDDTGYYSRVNQIARAYAEGTATAAGSAASGGTSGSATGAINTASATIDFTNASGVPVGSYETSIELPGNAIIIRAWYYVISALTADNAANLAAATFSIGVAVDDPQGIADWAPADSLAWSAGMHEGMGHKTTGMARATAITTAARRVIYSFGGGQYLTAGKIMVVCEYVVTE